MGGRGQRTSTTGTCWLAAAVAAGAPAHPVAAMAACQQRLLGMRGRRGLASSMHWMPFWQSEREWERENRLAAVALVNIQIFGFCSATLQPKSQHQGLIIRQALYR
jgi:hypothetical protein